MRVRDIKQFVGNTDRDVNRDPRVSHSHVNTFLHQSYPFTAPMGHIEHSLLLKYCPFPDRPTRTNIEQNVVRLTLQCKSIGIESYIYM